MELKQLSKKDPQQFKFIQAVVLKEVQFGSHTQALLQFVKIIAGYMVIYVELDNEEEAKVMRFSSIEDMEKRAEEWGVKLMDSEIETLKGN